MLVMKYIDGENLHDYLRKNFKNITWKEKLEILLQISNGYLFFFFKHHLQLLINLINY